jgi:hypothetical protein
VQPFCGSFIHNRQPMRLRHPTINQRPAMPGFTILLPPKTIHELSPGARALLMDIAQNNSKVLPRLTGAPLELIGRQLAVYAAEVRGYALALTARGAAMVPKPRHARRA